MVTTIVCLFQAYCEVNQEFATQTIVALKKLADSPDSGPPLVWLHDYHLMLAANTIRNVSVYAIVKIPVNAIAGVMTGLLKKNATI